MNAGVQRLQALKTGMELSGARRRRLRSRRRRPARTDAWHGLMPAPPDLTTRYYPRGYPTSAQTSSPHRGGH
eukprot:scaffold91661_cov93-Phaeocystis_antarctica.AAC.1